MISNFTKLSKALFACVLLLALHSNVNAQEWEKLGNTNFTANHGIGFAIDGYGYILTGGNSATYNTNFHSQDFHRYDPITDTWESLPYDGISRGYGIGAAYEGKAYFGFGIGDGFSNLLNDLWEYDPVTEEFTELPSCPCVPRTHPAFAIMNNKIYVGMGGNNGNLGDWWEYDIATQVWTEKTGMPGNRHHPYMFVIGEDIYVGSGHRTTWFKYDVDSDTWTQIADLDDRVAGTQFAYEGKGYALSGTDTNHDNLSEGEFWQYIPENDSWLQLESHPGVSRWAPASFIIDNFVYMATGWTTQATASQEVEVYRYELGEAPVSIGDLDLTEKAPFEIYGNPAIDFIKLNFNIDIEEFSDVIIYDTNGQLVYESKTAQTEINVSEYASGSYWIQATVKGYNVKKGFVKM
ncbi:T9SS type A sorting domain-containing protein [Saprospiraceae bacterium]|nr:T9SS type A sorting domain-containing protein [Saprospiraceae bacterium]